MKLTFLISIICSLAMLIIERLVGIEWDFHPDSYTYATESTSVTQNLMAEGNILSVFNNGYYILCYILQENIVTITFMNMILFSLTNVIIFKKLNLNKKSILIYLILLNPYRLHLSTTLLKDSLIIYLFISAYSSEYKKYLSSLFLIILRQVSVLYFLTKFPKKILISLLILSFFAYLFIPAANEFINVFNESEMDFRNITPVPSFKEFGVFGIFIRSLIWPILAVYGGFLVLSPELLFLPLAVGAWMQVIYCKLNYKRINPGINIYIPLIFFSILVTGFSSYIRYVYPILLIIPIYLKENFENLQPKKFH